MKVFLSWSGSQSQKVAQVFHAWIPQVIQSIKPFISTTNIDKGIYWKQILKNELETTNLSILCLTRANRNRPWIAFEAGALSARATASICPFLLDFDASDIPSWAKQFQTTEFSREDVKELIYTFNRRLEDSGLDDQLLEKAFDNYWPEFEEKLNRILEPDPSEILANSYQETLSLLSESETVVKRKQNRLFQEILIRELADFRAKLKRWQQRKAILVDHNYDDFVEKAYASARRSVFATCSVSEIDSWVGRAGERLFAAHRKSPAKVTRVFVFESRQDVLDNHLEIARTHHRKGFDVRIYINDEDDFFHFPPDLSNDFLIVDDGLIIGKTSHRRNIALSEWHFNDRTEKDRFKGYRNRLERGCLSESDELIKRI